MHRCCCVNDAAPDCVPMAKGVCLEEKWYPGLEISLAEAGFLRINEMQGGILWLHGRKLQMVYKRFCWKYPRMYAIMIIIHVVVLGGLKEMAE